jgi:hypothetical protein
VELCNTACIWVELCNTACIWVELCNTACILSVFYCGVGVRQSPLVLCSAIIELILPASGDKGIEFWWNGNWQWKTKVVEEKCNQLLLCLQQVSHQFKLALLGEKLMINSPSYDKVFCFLIQDIYIRCNTWICLSAESTILQINLWQLTSGRFWRYITTCIILFNEFWNV